MYIVVATMLELLDSSEGCWCNDMFTNKLVLSLQDCNNKLDLDMSLPWWSLPVHNLCHADIHLPYTLHQDINKDSTLRYLRNLENIRPELGKI